MANTFAPFGFKWAGRLDGMEPNAGLQTRQILSTNNTPIYFGDPVANSSGYIVQSAGGTNPIDGIFYGCSYLSASQTRIIHSPYWPGTSDAVAGTIQALICSDPAATFIVQCGNTSTDINRQYGVADINHAVAVTLGTGSTATGFSGATVTGASVASGGTTPSALPFKITGLINIPVGNGGDPTTPYNFVLVTFNNETYKGLVSF